MPESARQTSAAAEELAIRSRRGQSTEPTLAGGLLVGQALSKGSLGQREPDPIRRSNVVALQRLVGNRAVQRRVVPESRRPAARVASSRIQRVGTIISSPANAGTSDHVTLTRGGANNKDAVKEMQRKLRSALGGMAKTLSADGIFGKRTESYVKEFQKKNAVPETGIVDAETWALLDAQGKSSVGRVERAWKQTMEPGDGSTMVQGMTSKYSYKIDSKKITVKVGINFVKDATHPPADLSAVVAKWTTRILGRWNQFKAVKGTDGKSRDIVFEIVSSGGNTVNVIDAMVGSDAANWSVPDNENDNGPAHEFGHMIGLEDEYQRGIDDYTRLHPETAKDDIDSAKGAFFGGDQYTDETSMMGTGALSGHADKSADPEPRHVRQFVSYVENYLGGKWEAVKK